jgi:tetratricopeptide (TPR) repeat protein
VLHAQTTTESREIEPGRASLADAQSLFYNGHYEAAAAIALNLISAAPDDLQLYELRTSALLFQIKRAIGDPPDKDQALKQCASCADLIAAFRHDTAEGLAHARAQLKSNPGDDNAQFMLGKLDLNQVWLYLGTLGRRTGWNEYWEARHSLDAVLERNPRHLRARLARAWIDYIVDTRMNWGTRWILGGGNKKKALAIMREAAAANEDFFTSAEARFALWDVQVREKNFGEALVTARELSVDFPRNVELTKFIDKHGTVAKPR